METVIAAQKENINFTNYKLTETKISQKLFMILVDPYKVVKKSLVLLSIISLVKNFEILLIYL